MSTTPPAANSLNPEEMNQGATSTFNPTPAANEALSGTPAPAPQNASTTQPQPAVATSPTAQGSQPTPAAAAPGKAPYDKTQHGAVRNAVHDVAQVFSGAAVKPVFGTDPATGRVVQTGTERVNPWAYYLSAALTGMAAGAQHEGKYREGALAGLGKGAEAEMGKITGERKEARGEATENERLMEQRKMNDATRAHLASETAYNTWQVTQGQAKAAGEAAAVEVGLMNEIGKNPDNKDLGVFSSFNKFNPDGTWDAGSFMAYSKDHPEVAKQLAGSHGSLVLLAVPHYTTTIDPETKQPVVSYDGVHAALVTKDWEDQKLDHDVTVPIFKPSAKKGEAGTWAEQPFKAGTLTNGEYSKLLMAQSNESAKFDNEKMVAGAKIAEARATQRAADAQIAAFTAQMKGGGEIDKMLGSFEAPEYADVGGKPVKIGSHLSADAEAHLPLINSMIDTQNREAAKTDKNAKLMPHVTIVGAPGQPGSHWSYEGFKAEAPAVAPVPQAMLEGQKAAQVNVQQDFLKAKTDRDASDLESLDEALKPGTAMSGFGAPPANFAYDENLANSIKAHPDWTDTQKLQFYRTYKRMLLPPDLAKKYLDANEGDKGKARSAALADGWVL